MITALAEFEYLTQQQLMVLADLAASAVSDGLRRLCLFDFVINYDLLRPAAYRLSAKGARIADRSVPKDRAYPVIQHTIHTAQAMIALRAHYPEATLIPRSALYAHGLHPSVGEHAARTDAGWVFFLVDDYLMRTGRLVDSWTRKHTPVGRFVNIAALRARGEFLVARWCDAASHYHVFTTDEDQHDRFQRDAANTNIAAHVELIKPVWRLSS